VQAISALKLFLPSLRILQGRASVLPLLSDHNEQYNRGRVNRHRVIIVNSEVEMKNQALIYSFCLESPYGVPKGIDISCVARKHHHFYL